MSKWLRTREGRKFRPTRAFGWGRRAKAGEGAGERYLLREPWGAMAEKMFMRGEKRKGERSSAGIMLERMLKRARTEGRYDTPSLIEVSKLVSQMVTNTRQGRAARGSGGGRGKKSLEETYLEVQQLRAAFDASGKTMMPAAAVAWLQAAGWPQGVEEKTVKARVAAWRREARDEVLDGDEGGGG